jgi:hypothetical protein
MLKINEAETLTIACDECDVSSFAKKNTAAALRWRAKLPAQAAPAADATPAAPAPKPIVPRSVPKAPAPVVNEPPAPPPPPKASAWAMLGVKA